MNRLHEADATQIDQENKKFNSKKMLEIASMG